MVNWSFGRQNTIGIWALLCGMIAIGATLAFVQSSSSARVLNFLEERFVLTRWISDPVSVPTIPTVEPSVDEILANPAAGNTAFISRETVADQDTVADTESNPVADTENGTLAAAEAASPTEKVYTVADKLAETAEAETAEAAAEIPSTPEAPAASVPAEREAPEMVGIQWGPYLEWAVENPGYGGNPFDLVATATFVHDESGATHTTELFYAGADIWKFRFTGTQTGFWTYTTASAEAALNGLTGTVEILPNSDARMAGFVSNAGNRWIRTARNRAFVPQYVMYGAPHVYYDNPALIEQDIQTFLVDHGFTGFHTPVFCRWFDINEPACRNIDASDPNPDLRTFQALELLITTTYNAGGTVHIWMWGDDARGQNPKKWGLNGVADQRLQRYIAARLGPLPGWTLGYGFDLHEWVTTEDLDLWHSNMQAHFGWRHLLGARGPKNELDQISYGMDYLSYEQHKPDYAMYVETIGTSAVKPIFSEDRFRIRDEGRAKDYTMEETRRGLWHSAMAGGVANIWGNLIGASGANDGSSNSAPYPNPEWIGTYSRFFQNRFFADMFYCNDLTDGQCLQRPNNAQFVLYKEGASDIALDLSAMAGAQPAVAVDAKAPYAELDLGMLAAEAQTWTAPYPSDWAIAIGTFSDGTATPPPTSTPIAGAMKVYLPLIE